MDVTHKIVQFICDSCDLLLLCSMFCDVVYLGSYWI